MWVSNGGTRVFHMRESKNYDENCNFYSIRVFQNAKKVIFFQNVMEQPHYPDPAHIYPKISFFPR